MKKIRKIIASLALICILFVLLPVYSDAKGATYYELSDYYYSKANCVVFAEPTYTSTVLTTLSANLPVKVIGYYSNGWYRINIGVICYCKMDSLTPAGEFGGILPDDVMGQEAIKIAKELGYEFHYLTLNKEKIVEKSIFNQYINKKCILYIKINDDFGIYFKMIYDDEVNSNIDLNFSPTITTSADGSRTIIYNVEDELELKGTIANYIFKVGYDKIVDNYIKSIDTEEFNLMNSYYTEMTEISFAPTTAITDVFIYERETMQSLSDAKRLKMSDLRKGIKYQEYDEKDYRTSISSKLRKDTEYIDYVLK